MARYLTQEPFFTVTGATTLPDLPNGTTIVFSGSNYTVTLMGPAVASTRVYTFINLASGAVVLSSSANIIGPRGTAAATYSMATNTTAMLVSNGTNFVLLDESGGPAIATTGNFSGLLTASAGLTASGGAITLSPASFNVAISPTGTGTVTISPAGTLTMNPTGAISITGSSTLTLGTAGQTTTMSGNVSATGSNQTVNLSPTGTGTVTINPATAGNINRMNIGATTRGTGAFTTLTANNTFSLTSTTASHSISSTTASNSVSSGALTVAGGLGVAGRATIDNVSITSTTGSTSTSTGALLVTGGAGIGGNIFAGGTISAAFPLYLNGNAITSNYTIASGSNAVSAGPITINSGVTVTVNGDWSIV